MRWHMHNGATRKMLGFIPDFLHDLDPRPAAVQFNEAYAHGVGWHSFGKGKWKLKLPDWANEHELLSTAALTYPGDPAFVLVASAVLHESDSDPKIKPELILIFDGGPWVVIKQLNSDEFDVSRMD